MKKYLRCFKDGLGITAGKVYEVIREERGYFVFIDDDKHEHLWSQGSVRGESYLDHFTLETEDDTPITVIPDESLGGVMREYREVKRKAAVGERIKITSDRSAMLGEDFKGTVHTVKSVDCSNADTDGKWADGSTLNPDHDDYVVLEPSDILVIDGARYRMVDRKAAVGERVLVVNTDDINDDGYVDGAVLTIYGTWSGGVDVDHDIALYDAEYRVLEPVETAATPQLSELPASDQIAENIAALAARVPGLEAKVAELGEAVRAVIEAGNPAKLSISTADVRSLVDDTTKKSPQQIRDEIVERAKADVKDLRKFKGTPIPNAHNGIHFWPETPELKDYIPMHTVEYVVNREKRRVTAIIHNKIRGRVNAVGRATCAPNDVFNVHIGKAIALRRALGLEVPSEYLSAPNPEEPRVGDLVKIVGNYSDGIEHHYDIGDVGKVTRINEESVSVTGVRTKDSGRSKHGYYQDVSVHDVYVINGTREEVAA